MTRSATGPAPAAPLPSPKERRRLREARALSEEQVAAAVGVTPATVRAWETGRTSPRGRRRTAYARLIGCDEHRPAPPPSVEATGSSTMSPTEPGTGTAPDAPTPGEPSTHTPTPRAPGAPPPEASAPGVPAQDGGPPGTTAPDAHDAAPQPPPALTAEEAYDALYGRTAPGLTRQMYLLTGRRTLAREAVEHAFRITWQRWPEVARDRDPAGWVRAASYEYAMSPWHRLRRAHRRPDALPEDPARRALLDALLGLPPAYRRTLLLHDGVGLGLPETAAETEASTPATASRLLNARAAVAERLPGTVEPTEPGGRPALHDRLGALALAEEVPEPPPAPAVRAGSERIAELWTRAALCFGAMLIGTTAFTLHTAPTQYVQPLAPAERVGGVPPLGGPEKLTPQDLKLQKSLRGELTHGPERLVPRIP
ncbi:helix-turn-helix domain-containing protein [Streptomyces sp. NBC_01166]|uniref:helix-turn-helix domain-containing protein n=1 Tax=Streptomyces sp. NBC_01166 TaxID=2903755 RepID=UPI0038659757|nr:helix-turn-helix domain-containing protein [Streptomyces sp. NBC_01166]